MKKLIGHIIDFFTIYRLGEFNLLLELKLSIKKLIPLKEISPSIVPHCLDKNLKTPVTGQDPKEYRKYNWDTLKRSISKYGLLKAPLIQICNTLNPIDNKTYKYCVKDGNHRITVLKELYPPDYKIKVKIYA